jgi:uncharacterized protein YjbI with pentapeptide repeats
MMEDRTYSGDDNIQGLLRGHLELLRRWRSLKGDERFGEEITGFARRVATDGKLLIKSDEREKAQGILDYWKAEALASLPTTTAVLLPRYLEPFSPGHEHSESSISDMSLEGDRLLDAREQVRLSGSARQWKKSGDDPGYLLSGTALKAAEPYGEKDAGIAEFVRASRDWILSRRKLHAAVIVATIATTILLALIFEIVFPRWKYMLVSDIRNPSKSSWIEFNFKELSLIHTWLPFVDVSNLDFSGFKLNARKLQYLDLNAPNFVKTTLSDVNLSMSHLDNAAFTRSTITGGTNFTNAELGFSQFRASTVNGASFEWAKLYRASFEGSYICDANFSQADLLGAEFTVSTCAQQFQSKYFTDTAWWLAVGWSKLQLAELLKITVNTDSLIKSAAFCSNLDRLNNGLRNAAQGSWEQANALNDFAWTLSTWGVHLSEPTFNIQRANCPKVIFSKDVPESALSAIEKAILIVEGPAPREVKDKDGESGNNRYHHAKANFLATKAYILMQMDGHLPEAAKILEEVKDELNDPAVLFRSAVAELALGVDPVTSVDRREENNRKASATLSNLTNATTKYVPSHELFLLRKILTMPEVNKVIEPFIWQKECTSDANRG